MKRKAIILGFSVIAAAAAFLFSACGVKDLVLDDSWAVTRIETADVIEDNLYEWLTVTFNAEEETARIAAGSATIEGLPRRETVFQISATVYAVISCCRRFDQSKPIRGSAPMYEDFPSRYPEETGLRYSLV